MLTLIGRGLSNPEICAQLYISEATTKTHVSRALAKLQARTAPSWSCWPTRAVSCMPAAADVILGDGQLIPLGYGRVPVLGRRG